MMTERNNKRIINAVATCENELLLTLEDKLKPNMTEFPFLYYNG